MQLSAVHCRQRCPPLCRHTQTYATKLNDAVLTTCLGQGLALTPLSQLVQKVGATVPCGSKRCKAIRNADCETAVRAALLPSGSLHSRCLPHAPCEGI